MISYKNKFNPFLLRKFQKIAKQVSVAWSEIIGKPSTFPPDAHIHPEYIQNIEKAISNGVATLDLNAKIPLSQIPDSILGQVVYEGLWAASTNTPVLPDSTTVKGHYYIASDAGTYNSLQFQTGDWIISDGTNWTKVDNTDAVSSVFGRKGNITPQTGDYTYSQITGLIEQLALKLNIADYSPSGGSSITTVSNIQPTNPNSDDRWIIPDTAESGYIQQAKDMLIFENSIWYSLTGAGKYIGKIIISSSNEILANGDFVSVSISRTDRFFRWQSNNGLLGKLIDNDFTRIFEYAQNDVLSEDLFAQINAAPYIKLPAGTTMPYSDMNVVNGNQSTFLMNRIYADMLSSSLNLSAITSGTIEFYLTQKNNTGSNSRLFFYLFKRTSVLEDKLNSSLTKIFYSKIDNLVVGKNTASLTPSTITYLQANYLYDFGILFSYGGNSSNNEDDYIIFDTAKHIKLILE